LKASGRLEGEVGGQVGDVGNNERENYTGGLPNATRICLRTLTFDSTGAGDAHAVVQPITTDTTASSPVRRFTVYPVATSWSCRFLPFGRCRARVSTAVYPVTIGSDPAVYSVSTVCCPARLSPLITVVHLPAALAARTSSAAVHPLGFGRRTHLLAMCISLPEVRAL